MFVFEHFVRETLDVSVEVFDFEVFDDVEEIGVAWFEFEDGAALALAAFDFAVEKFELDLLDELVLGGRVLVVEDQA